jgi:hypothetical protein
MRDSRQWRWPLTAFAALALAAVPLATPTAAPLAAVPVAALAAAASSGWQLVPAPSPGKGVFNAFFTSVTQVSPTDVWAVGTDRGKPLIENWDGSAWSVSPVPKLPRAAAALNGVSADGPDDVWAVGDTVNSEGVDARTLALHWNGAAWAVVPTPNFSVTPGSGSILNSVVALSPVDAWAVGQGLNNDAGQLVALVEHWNGTSWHEVATPTPPGDAQWLTGVSADSPSDIWAVGVDDTTASARTLTVHFNGSVWTVVPSPNPVSGNSQNDLSAVTAIAPGDAWAVGTETNVGNQNFRIPLILHWTGTAWAQVTAPNPGTEGTATYGVAALGSDDVWAVGETYQAAVGAPFTTYAAQWNGTGWTQVHTPNGPSPDGISNLSAITALPDGELWAAGTATPATGCCERVLTEHDPNG